MDPKGEEGKEEMLKEASCSNNKDVVGVKAEEDSNPTNLVMMEEAEEEVGLTDAVDGFVSGNYNNNNNNDGEWIDDTIFGFCKYGCCHPTVLWSILCFPILLGQVMTRLDLNWRGRPRGTRYWGRRRRGRRNQSAANPNAASNRTCVHMAWTVGFLLGACLYMSAALASSWDLDCGEPFTFSSGNYSDDHYYYHRHVKYTLPTIIAKIILCRPLIWAVLYPSFYIMPFYFIYVLRLTRQTVRRRYRISADSEDTICTVFCAPCTTAQLARQTANDYLEEGTRIDDEEEEDEDAFEDEGMDEEEVRMQARWRFWNCRDPYRERRIPAVCCSRTGLLETPPVAASTEDVPSLESQNEVEMMERGGPSEVVPTEEATGVTTTGESV